jgi:hypothetical protein
MPCPWPRVRCRPAPARPCGARKPDPRSENHADSTTHSPVERQPPRVIGTGTGESTSTSAFACRCSSAIDTITDAWSHRNKSQAGDDMRLCRLRIRFCLAQAPISPIAHRISTGMQCTTAGCARAVGRAHGVRRAADSAAAWMLNAVIGCSLVAARGINGAGPTIAHTRRLEVRTTVEVHRGTAAPLRTCCARRGPLRPTTAVRRR